MLDLCSKDRPAEGARSLASVAFAIICLLAIICCVMNRYLLLFDIDGTLLLCGGAGVDAMRAVGSRLFGETFTFDGVEFAGNLDPLIFAEAARRCQLADDHAACHDRFRAAYVGELATRLLAPDRVTVMPGVHALLTRLRTLDRVVLGLLSGNYAEAAPLKLTAARIDHGQFRITAFGDEAPARHDLVELAMRRYARLHGERIDPRRVLVIGDTPRDVAAARAHGCIAVAVATGGHSADELRACEADLVLPDLADPTPITSLLV